MSAIETLQLGVIESFVRSAERFCECIEHGDDLDAPSFARRCAAALAAVYLDVLSLPRVEPCEEMLDPPKIDTAKAYHLAHKHLNKLNGYSVFFNPYDEASATTTIIGDDLAGIYRDLREGLELYRLGTDCAIFEAIVLWQITHDHWGRHLVSALTALHAIIAGNLLADDERPD